MHNPNSDILALISLFVEPDPIVYTRLAAVSRTFYHEFTSDRTWSPLDVYNIKKGIFHHFIKTSRDSRSMVRFMWQEGKKFLMDESKIANGYAQLGYLAMRAKKITGTNVELVKMAVNIKPHLLRNCSKDLRSNAEVVLTSFKHGQEALYYADDTLRVNQPFFCSVIQVLGVGYVPKKWNEAVFYSRYTPHLFEWFDFSVPDEEGAEYALKVCPSPVLYATTAGYMNHLPNIREYLDCLVKDRAELLRVIAGNLLFLDLKVPQYWLDRELCLAAFQEPIQPLADHPNSFYSNITDIEVIKAAIVAYPVLTAFIPSHYMANKEVVLHLLENVHMRANLADGLGDLYPFVKSIDQSLWSDIDIITVALDRGFKGTKTEAAKMTPQDIYSAVGFADKKVFRLLCDDYDWIKARIQNRSDSWNLASHRLQQDAELFLLAIEGEIAVQSAPHGLVFRARYNKKIRRGPKVFDDNQKVIEALGTLRPISDMKQSKMVKEVTAATISYHGLVGYHSCEDLNIVKAALEANPEDAKYVDSKVLVKRPQLLDYYADQLYMYRKLWHEPELTEIVEQRFGPEPGTDLGDPQTREFIVSQRLSSLPVGLLDNFDIELAAKAIQRDPAGFAWLPQHLMEDPKVQMAMEPMESKTT